MDSAAKRRNTCKQCRTRWAQKAGLCRKCGHAVGLTDAVRQRRCLHCRQRWSSTIDQICRVCQPLVTPKPVATAPQQTPPVKARFGMDYEVIWRPHRDAPSLTPSYPTRVSVFNSVLLP